MGCQAARVVFDTLAYPYPGQSTTVASVLSSPKQFNSCVRPGVLETSASFLRPARALSNEDLPTFDRPMNAISALESGARRCPGRKG